MVGHTSTIDIADFHGISEVNVCVLQLNLLVKLFFFVNLPKLYVSPRVDDTQPLEHMSTDRVVAGCLFLFFLALKIVTVKLKVGSELRCLAVIVLFLIRFSLLNDLTLNFEVSALRNICG